LFLGGFGGEWSEGGVCLGGVGSGWDGVWGVGGVGFSFCVFVMGSCGSRFLLEGGQLFSCFCGAAQDKTEKFVLCILHVVVSGRREGRPTSRRPGGQEDKPATRPDETAIEKTPAADEWGGAAIRAVDAGWVSVRARASAAGMTSGIGGRQCALNWQPRKFLTSGASLPVDLPNQLTDTDAIRARRIRQTAEVSRCAKTVASDGGVRPMP